MQNKGPKNTSQYFWTEHAKYKMQYYGLGAQKILGVIRRPKRKEEGIVKDTIAVMQPTGSKRPSEIWVMYQNHKTYNIKHKTKGNLANRQIRIISAWRYPGTSPQKNPIPEEILEDLREYI